MIKKKMSTSKKSKTVPIELDSKVKIKIEELDSIIANYINQRVQDFTRALTEELNDKGYDLLLKIDATFKLKDSVERID